MQKQAAAICFEAFGLESSWKPIVLHHVVIEFVDVCQEPAAAAPVVAPAAPVVLAATVREPPKASLHLPEEGFVSRNRVPLNPILWTFLILSLRHRDW